MWVLGLCTQAHGILAQVLYIRVHDKLVQEHNIQAQGLCKVLALYKLAQGLYMVLALYKLAQGLLHRKLQDVCS